MTTNDYVRAQLKALTHPHNQTDPLALIFALPQACALVAYWHTLQHTERHAAFNPQRFLSFCADELDRLCLTIKPPDPSISSAFSRTHTQQNPHIQ